jgi:hypothetical protein
VPEIVRCHIRLRVYAFGGLGNCRRLSPGELPRRRREARKPGASPPQADAAPGR